MSPSVYASIYGYLGRCRGPDSTGIAWRPTELDLHLHLLNLQADPASFATRYTYLRFHTAWADSSQSWLTVIEPNGRSQT